MNPDLDLHFSQLDRLLRQTRHLWQRVPFTHRQLPWQDSLPALCAWLEQLPEARIDTLEQHPAELYQVMAPWLGEADTLQALCAVPDLEVTTSPYPAHLANRIKGRKLDQIQAFAAAVSAARYPILEWCAGKGHLGRLLAWQQQRQVQSIEWQAPLCAAGQVMADQFQLPVSFIQADVLSGEADRLLTAEQHVIALHACGQLHIHLLRQASRAGTREITLSPCCYHLIDTPTYQPLSEAGQASDLSLSQHDLRLPLQQTAVAGDRITRLRAIEVAWRLGFDAMQQLLTGNPHYLPVPPVSKSVLGGSFAEFCAWAAAKKAIQLPQRLDYGRFEQAGWQHRQVTRRIELVRHLFRRPLELWLVLDRALFLQQHGYRVQVHRFCPFPVTPRNLLIRAQRLSG